MKLTIVLLAWLGMYACIHPPALVDMIHLKDVKHHLATKKNFQTKSDHNFGLLKLYRSSDRLLYSKCANFPSDSFYLKSLLEQNCPPWKSLLLASGRVLREHDLHKIPHRLPQYQNGHLVWIDLPIHCQ